jgi:hypothetical protein
LRKRFIVWINPEIAKLYTASQGLSRAKSEHCALTRANRVFGTDEKRIRTKNTVMNKSKNGFGGLSKIADCVRMCFSSARNRRSARTGRRPRKTARRSVSCPDAYRNCGYQPLRAPRANRGFCTDEKRIRTETTVMDKSNIGLGPFLSKIATLQQRGTRFKSSRINFTSAPCEWLHRA